MQHSSKDKQVSLTHSTPESPKNWSIKLKIYIRNPSNLTQTYLSLKCPKIYGVQTFIWTTKKVCNAKTATKNETRKFFSVNFPKIWKLRLFFSILFWLSNKPELIHCLSGFKLRRDRSDVFFFGAFSSWKCGALGDLVPSVQFKNVKNTHGGKLILIKLKA